MNYSESGFSKRMSFREPSIYLILLFALFGFLLTVTQIYGEGPDYFQYENFFDLLRREDLNSLELSRFEPGFLIFSLVLTTLFSINLVVYSWIVFAAMLLKGWAFHICSASLKIALVVATFYIVRYFPLHELTQLRTACASSLILVGAITLWNGNLRYGILICCSAMLFQISSIVIILALFLVFEKRWQVLIVATAVFIFALIFSNFITNYLADSIQILNAYQMQGFAAKEPNPHAVQLLIDWWMIVFSLIVWERLTLLMKRIILLQLIGMAIFYGAVNFGVIAHRMRELFSVFWVFYLADGLRLRATRIMSYGFVSVCILWYSYVFVFSGKFFWCLSDCSFSL